jgi:hypothetical protein
MSDATDSFIGGFLIGVVLLGILRFMWFFVRSAWWLLVFLVLCLGSGIMALTKINGAEPEIDGAGEYSEDRSRWLDHASGRWYQVSPTDEETCTIQSIENGFFWKSTALSRLLRGGAITRCKFLAVDDATGRVVAEWQFPQEARHDITLDHLDPAYAALDQYGLSPNRDRAQDALKKLDSLLAVKGWKNIGYHRQDHWFADVYRRHMIQWNTPLDAATAA